MKPSPLVPAAAPLLDASVLDHMLTASPGAIRVLDVRTPAEFETAHIPGAYNVPVDRVSEYAGAIGAVDAPLVLVCRSGQRASRARAILDQAGLRQLHVLDGGLETWMAAGRTVTRGQERMSLERQVRIAAGALGAVGAMLALSVSPLFAVIPALVGSGLVFAGLTDTCAMGSLLGRLPYNQTSCDVGSAVRALRAAGDASAPLPVRTEAP